MGVRLRAGLAAVDRPAAGRLDITVIAIGRVKVQCGRAPLVTRLISRHGSSPTNGISRRKRSHSPPSPCNIYLGEDFCVRLGQYFKLNELVKNNKDGGVIHTSFDPFKRISQMTLSDHAKRIRDVPNAGGNSVFSEVLSFELLKKCFQAQLLKTEMEVDYYPHGGSITDYTCCMFGTMLGVSVTRAMKFKGEFTIEDAERLLSKKLKGVVQSSRNSVEKWSKQILHVWATSRHVANILTRVYDTIPEDTRTNTVVLITVASNADEIFTNQ